MLGTIYQIRHVVSGTSYVGATSQKLSRRIGQHFCDAKTRPPGRRCLIHIAISELGRDSFEVIVLDHASSTDELIEKEAAWIAKLATVTPYGFNKAEKGSVGSGERNPFWGRKHSDSSKLKMAESSTGKKASENARMKMSLKGKGRPKSEEWKRNMSLLLKGKPCPARATIASEETRRKIAESKKGLKLIGGRFVRLPSTA